MADSAISKNRMVRGFLGAVIKLMPHPSIPYGAQTPGTDFSVRMEEPVYMELVNFVSPDRINGLLMYDSSTTQYFFFGYKCGVCKKIYLVPESADSIDTLIPAMRHECCPETMWARIER
jgi:hypothetical protein